MGELDSTIDYSITYEVNVSVPQDKAEGYQVWLQSFTANVVTSVGGFTQAVVYSQPKPGTESWWRGPSLAVRGRQQAILYHTLLRWFSTTPRGLLGHQAGTSCSCRAREMGISSDVASYLEASIVHKRNKEMMYYGNASRAPNHFNTSPFPRACLPKISNVWACGAIGLVKLPCCSSAASFWNQGQPTSWDVLTGIVYFSEGNR